MLTVTAVVEWRHLLHRRGRVARAALRDQGRHRRDGEGVEGAGMMLAYLETAVAVSLWARISLDEQI